MAKLYPPIINGVIPAFYGDQLMVPFSMNPAVSRSEVAGFSIKVKDSLGDYKCTIEASKADSNVAYFSISKVKDIFHLGQYYKIQLAYINTKHEVGYYSSIGIIKYTSYPDISIDGLNAGGANSHQYNYTGVFSQKNGDQTEKMYSSFFRVTDASGNIITQSDEQLHNFNEDTLNYEQRELFSFLRDLEENKTYKIQFFAKSLNEIANSNQDNFLSSPQYQIIQKPVVNKSFSVDLYADLDEENGVVELTLGQVPGYSDKLSGSYMITRSCNGDKLWEEFKRIDIDSTAFKMDEWLLLDTTVEQGKTYQYAIQQFNDYGLKSQRIESNPIFVDFEYIFLSDDKKQLKIKYNPRVSSFKHNVLENKTDAIGNKYPIISRNGFVGYKEFPISGLLSYHEDEEEYFISKENLGLTPITYTRNISVHSMAGKDFYQKTIGSGYNDESYNLSAKNFYSERMFKQDVLDWLNNGKVKLFRSASEGNYIVRLMNVSLSPTDSLSRMIHTFSATAYEVDEFNLDSLRKYNLISDSRKAKRKVVSRRVALSEKAQGDGTINLLEHPALKIKFNDLSTQDLSFEIGNNNFNNSIIIPASKTTYELEFENPITYLDTTVTELKKHPNATLEIWYDVEDTDSFSVYKNLSIRTIISEPHYGTNYTKAPGYGEMENIPAAPGAVIKPSTLPSDYCYSGSNPKEVVQEHVQTDAEQRPEININSSSNTQPSTGVCVFDKLPTFGLTGINFSPDTLYHVFCPSGSSYWLDGQLGTLLSQVDINNRHTINFGQFVPPIYLSEDQPCISMTPEWLAERGATGICPGVGVILRDTKTVMDISYTWEDLPSYYFSFTPAQLTEIQKYETAILNCNASNYDKVYTDYIQYLSNFDGIEINEIVERLRNLFSQYSEDSDKYKWGWYEYTKYLGQQACNWESMMGGY